jgi:hypothetical protein
MISSHETEEQNTTYESGDRNFSVNPMEHIPSEATDIPRFVVYPII